MKPYAYIFLVLLTLLVPFALRATLPTPPERPAAAGGAPRLVIITPNNQDIRQEFARAFSAWHRSRYGTPVDCDFRVPGGTADIKRQLETSYRHARDPATGAFPPSFRPDYDVLWGGGDFFFDHELKPLGLFQPLGLPPSLLREAFPQPALAGVRLYDASPAPQWAGVALSSFGIVYNPDLYATLGLPPPRTWSDLTDPRLSGLVALADPTHSGSVAVAYMMVLQRAMADEEERYLVAPGTHKSDPACRAAVARGWKRGMSQLVLMAANARSFTASATQVPADVAAGDAAAGVSIDLYARVTAEIVGPRRARYVTPKNATALTPDPVAILAGVRGDRLTLARHFVEFLLGRDGQRLWALKAGVPGGPRDRALRRLPVRQDVYATDRADWSDPEEDPFATAAGGFNQRAEWMGQFADLRGLWRAAWIDARDDLHSAYAAVLAVKDNSRRAALLAKLADLPIEMGDLDALRAERKRVQSNGGDVERWKARQQIAWAERFRRHYADVAAEAGR